MNKFGILTAVSVAGLLILPSLALAGNNPGFQKANDRLSVSEMDWDFGYIPKDASVTHRFLIKNTGSTPLKITNVKPACGCTSAPLGKSDLAPGEVTDLEVTFNARNYRGKVNKSVAIFTDDSVSSVTNLKFTTDVGSSIPTLIMDKDAVSFDSVALGNKASVRLKIVNNDIQPISLRIVEVPKSLISAQLKKAKLNIGDESELTLSLDKTQETKGFFNKTVTMQVDGHVNYRLSLPITGTMVEK
ncbi:MAG: DUF1573 domain-containing protein [candidate division Zixibacteria bacterium]|nr:DUF1573 domain-containing protein [candidate division Zixibacteria bacterium]